MTRTVPQSCLNMHEGYSVVKHTFYHRQCVCRQLHSSVRVTLQCVPFPLNTVNNAVKIQSMQNNYTYSLLRDDCRRNTEIKERNFITSLDLKKLEESI